MPDHCASQGAANGVRCWPLTALHSLCCADIGDACVLHVCCYAGVTGWHAAGVPAHHPVHWLDVLAGQQADAQHARWFWGAR